MVKKKWKVSGYIARSKDGSLAVICIYYPIGEKHYYIAQAKDVIACLSGKSSFVKLMKREE